MAPAIVTLDNTPDFDMAPPLKSTTRTLLLAPPTLASDETLLKKALGPHDRTTSDLHMLDRLSAGLVSLPPSTYDLVLLLAGADAETAALLNRNVLGSVHDALRPGGRIEGDVLSSVGEKEFVLAGLVAGGNGFLRPDYGETAVPLKLRRKKKEEKKVEEKKAPAGVGFVSLDDLDGDDDELIDESTLLTEEDLKRPLNIPAECLPKVGKRKRACKDCSCGLASRMAAEDAELKAGNDEKLREVKLGTNDLAEVDFTVQGKVGSCGSCALGDAFRCDGCPYIGLPPFKPGEEVRILNDEIQL